MLNSILLTANRAVSVMLRLLVVVIFVSLALILPPVVVILVAVIFSSFVAVISPELFSLLAKMLWLLLACNVPALVIRLLAVLSLLPLLFRCFLMLKSLPATMLLFV